MFWKNLTNQRKILLAFSLLIIASLACSLPFLGRDSSDPTSEPEMESALQENQEPAPEDELRCTRMGYPCTFAEADPERVERSMDLMDLADEVFANEGNSVAVAERLLEEDDIAEMYYDERGVWYRVEGAPPLIFLHPDAFAYGMEEEVSQINTDPASKTLLSRVLPEGDGPIGENPPGEKATKKALFVNPIVWQFGTDVYDAIEPRLREYRDYRSSGSITTRFDDVHAVDLINDQTQAAGPSYEQFLNWEDYDLIHVLAHGYQFCPGLSVVTETGQPVVSGDREIFPENTGGVIEGTNVTEGECITFVVSGHYQTRKHIQKNPREVPGIAWFHKPGEDTWGEVVTTDFFEAKYGSGLDDTIIVFTSCQLFRDESLAEVLRGTNTAVFGWTNTVRRYRGTGTATEFLAELIDNGLRSSVAYQKATESESHTDHDEDWYGAMFEKSIDPGTDPRGREVVILMQPVFRELLEEKDAVPVEGIAGDGENDELLILIQVDGVDEDQNLEDFEIHLAMDGEELQETFKPEDKVGDYSYRAYKFLPLPFDAADRDFVEFEAWVDLPEGGDTRHNLQEAEIAGCGWTGTASGSQSGPVKGEILFPSTNLNSANAEQLALLANEGYLGPGGDGGSGMPSASELSNLPFSAIFANRSQFPFMLIVPDQSATVMLDTSSFGVGQQASFNLQENSQERFEGSFSASLTDMRTQSGYSVQGEMIWHVDSFCSLDVIIELAANPLPASLAP